MDYLNIVSDLLDSQFFPETLREKMLEHVLNVTPAGGPCTLLQLTTFFSAGGARIGEVHIRKPSRWLLFRWLKHIKDGNSEIEKRIYVKRTTQEFGVALLNDLFSAEEWKECSLYDLAQKCNVHDIAYLWIRCAENDLWVICLRRCHGEDRFSTEDCFKLMELGSLLHRLKKHWYSQDFHLLTTRELEVVRATISGLSAKQVASKLNIRKRTVDKHLENARLKIGVDSTTGVAAKLWPINNALRNATNNPIDRNGGSTAS